MLILSSQSCQTDKKVVLHLFKGQRRGQLPKPLKRKKPSHLWRQEAVSTIAPLVVKSNISQGDEFLKQSVCLKMYTCLQVQFLFMYFIIIIIYFLLVV